MEQRLIASSSYKPYIPILKQYLGFPFIELELQARLADLETNPEAFHGIILDEYVSMDDIDLLLEKYFDNERLSNAITNVLYLTSNLYYCGNESYYRQGDSVDYQNQAQYQEQEERIIIREEIAQLYSYIQKRKQQGIGLPITFKTDKGDKPLHLDNTCGWFEALLDNHLFPNCIPDVKGEKDAKQLCKTRDKGRTQDRPEVNAIVHGVAGYLRDQKVYDGQAPKNLCKFIRVLLKEMGYLSDNWDADHIDEKWISSQIKNFKKQKEELGFANAQILTPSLEDLQKGTLDQRAYSWLFNPSQDSSDSPK